MPLFSNFWNTSLWKLSVVMLIVKFFNQEDIILLSLDTKLLPSNNYQRSSNRHIMHHLQSFCECFSYSGKLMNCDISVCLVAHWQWWKSKKFKLQICMLNVKWKMYRSAYLLGIHVKRSSAKDIPLLTVPATFCRIFRILRRYVTHGFNFAIKSVIHT